ncbi:MAG: NTP transferase domain-containing protein, partial [Verrucomicrobiaceae bacterium]|nr:NTP transferase domain-containing protein [Verrucomicrobiaceae bacterium]
MGAEEILSIVTRPISEAVILMAGKGSRLGMNGVPKPLLQVAGRALISHLIDALERKGVTTIHAVVGYQMDLLVPGLRAIIPAQMELHLIENHDWHKQNGVSVLAAAEYVSSQFVLAMSDHIFDAKIVDLLIRSADTTELNVAVDRKLHAIFDTDDAMKLRTRGDRVIEIGKRLGEYDAIDTGLFVCPVGIFEYLRRANRDGDCSLADGVRLMASDDKVRAVDIGDAWWQDVDTPEMLREAR